MRIIDKELGIEVELPNGWKISNTTDGTEITIERDKDCFIKVLYKSKATDFYINKIIGIECKPEENKIVVCDGKKIYIKKGKYQAIISVCNNDDFLKIIDNLKISTPTTGIIDDFKRITSSKIKWYISLPESWEYEEIGKFKDGVLIRSGKIKAWILFYPTTNLFTIEKASEMRFNELTRGLSIKNIERKKEGNKYGFIAEAKIGEEEYLVTLELSKYKIQGDMLGYIETDFDVYMETGFIIPKHVKDAVLEIIGKAFSTFSIGINFLREYMSMSNAERFLYAIAYESKLLGYDACKILSKYMEEAENVKKIIEHALAHF